MATSTKGQLQAPSITLEDLQSFHARHFPGGGQPPAPNFSLAESDTQINENKYYEDDDDGLGYYPDGVKRTLTDEQIRIFRHSEIHALLRERQLEEERRLQEEEDSARDISMEWSNVDETRQNNGKASTLSSSPVQAKTGQKHDVFPGINKPSTSGSDRNQSDMKASGLDYDDDFSHEANMNNNATAAAAPRFAGRRIISYDD